MLYQPKIYSIALVTMPEFLLGVLTMPETSCSLWAALNDWVRGLMDRLWVAKLEFKLITDVSWLLVWSRIWDALAVASAGGSRQGLTPTMRLPPKIRPVRPRAFCACIFVWKRIFIQLPFGGIWCCKIVPPEISKMFLKITPRTFIWEEGYRSYCNFLNIFDLKG